MKNECNWGKARSEEMFEQGEYLTTVQIETIGIIYLIET